MERDHQNKQNSKRAGTLSADGDAVGRDRQRPQDDDNDNIRANRDATGLSSTAILADRQRVRDGGAAISERPSESGRDSTPPGTIADYHDVRSEHIQAAAHFNRHRVGLPLDVNREISSGEDSVRAHRSVTTKAAAVAVTSQKIVLRETNRA